ncbi:hypothetical protein B0H65DRAFT_427801, partial [Neurospora tetraspora]
EDPERLLSLIFTFPAYISMVKIFPEIIIINNTYNTNRFNYPFYQISNVSSISSIFNYIFSIINDEKEVAFNFLIEATYKIRSQYNLPAPSIIITNKYKEMK